MTLLESILIEHGPALSGDIAKQIEAARGVAPETSRKQLSRFSEPVKRIKGFFINNQSFYYLPEHIADGSFIEELTTALKTSAKRLFVLIKALEYNKGYLHKDHLAAYGFSPVENLVGHRRFDTVVREGLRHNLIVMDGDYYKLNDEFYPKKIIDFRYHKGISIARDFLINQFADWACKIGLVSFDSAEYFREFSKFSWAVTGPSYVGTLPDYTQTGIKPGFVLADFVVGNQVSDDHVHFFVEKLKVIKALAGHSRILPFLIVDVVPPQTLQLLKQNGVIVGFVHQMFGNGYIDLIKALINTVVNAAAILKSRPDDFLALMDKIKILTEGKTNNLRGDVFELAVGYYHAKESRNFDISKKVYWEGEPYELDVFAVYEDRVVVAECKGTKGPIELEAIDKWLTKIVDVREWINEQEAYKGKRHQFEFWSTGGFDVEASDKIEIVSKTKKYDNLFLGPDAILEKASKLKSPKFTAILKEYFLKEPV